jgi:ABC-2 type transport system permease protein
VLVLLTTLLFVWAAGRIFRVGILMQGKGANLAEMMKWVFRG